MLSFLEFQQKSPLVQYIVSVPLVPPLASRSDIKEVNRLSTAFLHWSLCQESPLTPEALDAQVARADVRSSAVGAAHGAAHAWVTLGWIVGSMR